MIQDLYFGNCQAQYFLSKNISFLPPTPHRLSVSLREGSDEGRKCVSGFGNSNVTSGHL